MCDYKYPLYECPLCGGWKKRCALLNNDLSILEFPHVFLREFYINKNHKCDNCWENDVCFLYKKRICFGFFTGENYVYYGDKIIYINPDFKTSKSTPFLICASCFREPSNKPKITGLFPKIKINWNDIYCFLEWQEIKKEEEETWSGISRKMQIRLKKIRNRENTPTVSIKELELNEYMYGSSDTVDSKKSYAKKYKKFMGIKKMKMETFFWLTFLAHCENNKIHT